MSTSSFRVKELFAAALLRPPDERAALFALDLRPGLARDPVNEHEAQIMARPFILRARIAQPDD